MTKEETKQILTVLRINYPHSFKNLSNDDAFAYLDLWTQAFKDDDVRIVTAAVQSIIYSDTREFAPNIAQVKSRMQQLINGNSITEQEAWEYIRKACGNSLYNSKKEHDKLPPVIQGMVSADQLKQWAQLPADEFNTVIQSNFMRSYKVRASQEQQIQMLPNEIKSMISNLTAALKITDKDGDSNADA